MKYFICDITVVGGPEDEVLVAAVPVPDSVADGEIDSYIWDYVKDTLLSGYIVTGIRFRNVSIANDCISSW